MTERRIGVAVIGFGWMGQAHARSYARLPMIFGSLGYRAELTVCADTLAQRREMAARDFGFGEVTDDWRVAVDHPGVDVVAVCAPNMLHCELVEAAAAAGKHVFCEKPVGGTPEQTARAEKACRAAGVTTGVGYNYRFVPLVQHARNLIEAGELGQITNYRGRFFSMYGADPLGLLSWRFLLDQAGHGVSTDILSHAIDLAMMLNGPILRVVGAGETFIKERPLPSSSGTHYDRGALSWNFETMNQMRLFRTGDGDRGYTTVYAGERHPYHAGFVPGEANSIGFEDVVTIQDHEFLAAVAEGRPHTAGMEQALEYVSVQAALLRSWETGTWTDVVSVRID